jgi:hypothetical protein
MMKIMTQERSFQAKIEGSDKARAYIVVPFDPEAEWGARPRYHIRGTIDRHAIRGPLDRSNVGWFLSLGPAYRRDNGLKVGDRVSVTLTLEGPQADALAPDIVSALSADPAAKAFFDGLPTFYRKKYLRWIDATKRSPATRAQRIAELVRLMKASVKDLP